MNNADSAYKPSAQTASWYIVQNATGQCEIQSLETSSKADELEISASQTWGPYESKSAAVAKRVGLIRAGKCKPM